MSFLDVPRFKLIERMTLKKFDGDVQDDAHLTEMMVMEDGVVVDYWSREDDRIPPGMEGAVILNPPED